MTRRLTLLCAAGVSACETRYLEPEEVCEGAEAYMEQHPEDTGLRRFVFCRDSSELDIESGCEAADGVLSAPLASFSDLHCIGGLHDIPAVDFSDGGTCPDIRGEHVWFVNCKVYE